MSDTEPTSTSPRESRLRAFGPWALIALALALYAVDLDGSPQPLAPLPKEPAGGPCDVEANALWRSLLAYSPGDDAQDEDVRLSRRGARAHLEVIRDKLPDDSVATTRSRYDLAYSGAEGWRVTSCQTEAIRCWRGSLHDGKCP